MKITFDFSTHGEDRMLLLSVMDALTSSLSSMDEGHDEHNAPPVHKVGTVNAADSVPTSQDENTPKAEPKKRGRKAKPDMQKSEEAGEPTLSAVATDPGVQGKPASEDSVVNDLPFSEEEQPKKELSPASEPTPTPVRETKNVMTPQDFRAAIEDLRKLLGVERDTPESLALARTISTMCDTVYGTAKPSTLPGDKLAEFVNVWLNGLAWNADHTGFETPTPF